VDVKGSSGGPLSASRLEWPCVSAIGSARDQKGCEGGVQLRHINAIRTEVGSSWEGGSPISYPFTRPG
jgi:hypothetical protein